ncbi:MAG: cytochrome c [Betaproteobacteria bacterium]
MAIIKRASLGLCAALIALGIFVGIGDRIGAPAGISLVHTAAADPTPAAAPGEKPGTDVDYSDSGFRIGEAPLTPSERAGREIWYKATAGNARFHTYVFQQRVGVLIDWYRVLNAKERGDRFAAWGLINDPGCCTPGSANCPAKSLQETYGFDYCEGDSELLNYVGKTGYRDPGCDFKDAPADPNDPHNKSKDQRQSACDLAFGTSTGALGFRKFPNPRFDKARWDKLNSSNEGWEGFRKRLSTDKDSVDGHTSHLMDGSVEPPFLIGMSCGACHIAFDPLHAPKDTAHPGWQNIKGAIGNQYTRISELMVSGMPHDSLEYQVFAHARPGTSDTSAVPTDQVSNPGTMNAIINIKQRPTFGGESVNKWRKVASCAKSESDISCWCEPERDGKCWQKSIKEETVHHILKGGEDSIGALEAIQRVYFNIGSCSEQCWVNHLTDLRQLDPQARNAGQTPFDIGQCRRDCANFRAIEDRLPNVLDFLMSQDNYATDLQAARENERKAKNPKAKYTQDDFVADLNKQFGKDAVNRGRDLFAANCARCHSSIPETTGGPFKNRDFRAIDPNSGIRADWMGNDQATLVSEVGTFRCRALHSNHMAGHVWQEYGSETLRARAPDPNVKEPHDGGRGYYRNISLISVWAHAPLLHNNALGPEICGKPANADNSFYHSPYVERDSRKPLATAPACSEYDPSVEGRFKLFVASAEELLTPEDKRPRKITTFDTDVRIPVSLRVVEGGSEKQLAGFSVDVPKGTSSSALGSFQHKAFASDLLLSVVKPDVLQGKLAKQLGDKDGKEMAAEIQGLRAKILADPEKMIDTVKQHPKVLEAYSSCTADVENGGHRFGTDLSDADKKALIAFLATL